VVTEGVAAQDPEEQRRRWHNFFYRDGTPEIARTLLTEFVGEIAPALAAEDSERAQAAEATLVNMAVFFARAAARARRAAARPETRRPPPRARGAPAAARRGAVGIILVERADADPRDLGDADGGEVAGTGRENANGGLEDILLHLP
jgi:hypothetical protein